MDSSQVEDDTTDKSELGDSQTEDLKDADDVVITGIDRPDNNAHTNFTQTASVDNKENPCDDNSSDLEIVEEEETSIISENNKSPCVEELHPPVQENNPDDVNCGDDTPQEKEMEELQNEEENDEAQEKGDSTGDKSVGLEAEGNEDMKEPQPSFLNNSLRRRSYVYKKMSGTHKKSRDSFYCPFCQVTFCSNFSLMRHLVQIHDANEASNSKQIPPSICSLKNNPKKSSSTTKKDNTHTKSIEQNNAEKLELSKASGWYRCSICSATFEHLYDFGNHMLTNHCQESQDVRDSENDCHNDSQKSISTEFLSAAMQNQMRMDESSTSRTILCSSCGLKFPGPQCLVKHICEEHLNISTEGNFPSTNIQNSLNFPDPTTPPEGKGNAPTKSLGSAETLRLGGNDDSISEENDDDMVCTVCGEHVQEAGCKCTRNATGRAATEAVELNNIDPSVSYPILCSMQRNYGISGAEVRNKFPCPLCKSFFGRAQWVGRHMKKVHGQNLREYLSEIMVGGKRYICFVCNFSLSNCTSLKIHMDRFHPDVFPSNLIRPTGNISGTSNQNIHNSSNEVRSDANSEDTSHKKELNSPMSSSAAEETNPEQADLSESGGHLVENFRKDVQNSNTGLRPSDKRKETCPYCGEKFGSLAWLTRHLRTEHNKSRNELKNRLHLMTPSGARNPNTALSMPLESGVSANDSTLGGSEDKDTDHPSEKDKDDPRNKYTCKECGARFRNLAWLTRHRRCTAHFSQEGGELGPVHKKANFFSAKSQDIPAFRLVTLRKSSFLGSGSEQNSASNAEVTNHADATNELDSTISDSAGNGKIGPSTENSWTNFKDFVHKTMPIGSDEKSTNDSLADSTRNDANDHLPDTSYNVDYDPNRQKLNSQLTLEPCPSKTPLISAEDIASDFFCGHCAFKDGNKEKIICHLASVHAGIAPYRCRQCSNVFEKRFFLMKHIKERHGGKKELGELSVLYLQNKSVLRLSSSVKMNKSVNALPKESTPTKNENLTCKLCSYTARYPYNLAIHMKGHERRMESFVPRTGVELLEESTQEYNNCGPLNLSKKSANHQDRGNSKMGPLTHYSCDHCPFRTLMKIRFLYHKQFHRPNSSATYRCNFCCYWTNKKKELCHHKQLHARHPKKKDYHHLKTPLGVHPLTTNTSSASRTVSTSSTNLPRSLIAEPVNNILASSNNKLHVTKTLMPAYGHNAMPAEANSRSQIAITPNLDYPIVDCFRSRSNEDRVSGGFKLQDMMDRDLHPGEHHPRRGFRRSAVCCSASPSSDLNSLDRNTNLSAYPSHVDCGRLGSLVMNSASTMRRCFESFGSISGFPATSSGCCTPTKFSSGSPFKSFHENSMIFPSLATTGMLGQYPLNRFAPARYKDSSLPLYDSFEGFKEPFLLEDEESETRQQIIDFPKRSGVYMFRCASCPAAFSTPSVLRYHESLHNSKDAYNCTECNYSVRRLSSLRTHLLLHYYFSDASESDMKVAASATSSKSIAIEDCNLNLANRPTKPSTYTSYERMLEDCCNGDENADFQRGPLDFTQDGGVAGESSEPVEKRRRFSSKSSQ